MLPPFLNASISPTGVTLENARANTDLPDPLNPGEKEEGRHWPSARIRRREGALTSGGGEEAACASAFELHAKKAID
ncbi:hypothetical protein OsJ_22128 [Oryza sativa Japonica Group]|uniref:Uncharacterized protein n=1 Tax=Oryza sativa subsp. japonica TaxID=39947 RepID=B9FQ57_ORYSJ|nr:hypothetical protein OsJ_22128 [Oryza sativa Japonica Group]